MEGDVLKKPIAILAFAATLACGGAEPAAGGSVTGSCPITTVPAHPNFTTDILPALQTTCGSATSTCHGGPTAIGHVDYSTSLSRTPQDVYRDLLGATPANAPPGYERVKAGDPAHSWIVEKVSSDQPGGSGHGARMPLGRPNLCQPSLDALVAWISAGAPF